MTQFFDSFSLLFAVVLIGLLFGHIVLQLYKISVVSGPKIYIFDYCLDIFMCENRLVSFNLVP